MIHWDCTFFENEVLIHVYAKSTLLNRWKSTRNGVTEMVG